MVGACQAHQPPQWAARDDTHKCGYRRVVWLPQSPLGQGGDGGRWAKPSSLPAGLDKSWGSWLRKAVFFPHELLAASGVEPGAGRRARDACHEVAGVEHAGSGKEEAKTLLCPTPRKADYTRNSGSWEGWLLEGRLFSRLN